MPPQSRERIRLIQIYSYVDRRLNDPRLTAEAVAAAHGLSLRQLGRVLQSDGQSPAEWIRRQRLDRCRHDLLDPAQTAISVVAIGARWGYLDPTTFNRAFRREFGLPPGEFRRCFSGPAGSGDRVRNGQPRGAPSL